MQDFRADPAEGLSQPFSVLGIGGKKRKHRIRGRKDLVLFKKKGEQVHPRFNGIAEHAPKGQEIAISSLPGIGRTGFDALPAIHTPCGIKGKRGGIHGNDLGRTDRFTESTIGTGRALPFRKKPSFYAQVIFFGFKAIVPTAGDADLELVGQFLSEIPGIQLLGKLRGFNKPAGAYLGSLTGGNGSYPGPQAPGCKPTVASSCFMASISPKATKGISTPCREVR